MNRIYSIAAALLVSACLFSQKEFNVSGTKTESYSNVTNLPLMVSIDNAKIIPADKFAQWFATEYIKSQDISFLFLKETKDGAGMSHPRFQQLYKGVKVESSMIIAHCRNSNVISFNGDWFAGISVSNNNALLEQQALQFALNKVKAVKYKWDNAAEEKHVREVLNDPAFTYKPKGELVILPLIDYAKKTATFSYAYKFNIYAEEPLYRANVYVDAQTGAILKEQNLICTINTPATAATKYSGQQTIMTDSYTGGYRLRESGRGNGIETYNMNNTSSYTSTDFSNSSTSWSASYPDRVATDAHWGAEMTYDYFHTTFNRNSIDDNGFKLLSYVHYSNNYVNAFWDGQRMTYGDGSTASGFMEMAGLDVCGHEITHGLVQFTGQLSGGEASALNEGFADIFGTSVEWFARPSQHNWIMGNEIMTSNAGFRDMSNPNTFQQPNTYQGNYWDSGGEPHTNAGPCIYWFYLLSVGGSGTNDNGQFYNVSGITMAKAEAIAYRALNIYMTPNTDYANVRVCAIQAAKDLYGACSNEVMQTANAWYAVGVGPLYNSAVISPAFVADEPIACTAPATINFTNQTNAASAYTWYFGDGTSSTMANPAHTYTANGIYSVKLVATSCAGNAKDSLLKTSYVNVNTSNPCIFTMPSGNTTYSVCEATLYDDGGLNANYSDNMTRQISVVTNPGDNISISFTFFSMESGYDYLKIYKGFAASGTPFKSYTGNNLPNNGLAIATNTNVITVVQQSDQYLNEAGYVMKWSCSSAASVGINALSENSQVVMFPNPANDFLMFEQIGEVIQIEIINALGQTEKAVPLDHTPSMMLSVKDLSGGMYFVRFHTASGIITKKMLKQ